MCVYHVKRLTIEDLENPLAKKSHYTHFAQDRNTALYKTLFQSRRQTCAVVSNSINESVAGSDIFHIVQGSSHYFREKPNVPLSRDQAVASHAVSAQERHRMVQNMQDSVLFLFVRGGFQVGRNRL
jgi:hypothetical protein